MAAKYSIDTSSLVAAWTERYPIENFPTFWERMDELIETGVIVASKEVLLEMKRRDEALHKWFKDREDMFIEIDDDTQEKVIEIMTNFPKMVDERTNKSAGDPWVIAVAEAHNDQLAVVTEEKGGSAKRPTIPVVCEARDVRCIGLIDLIKEQRWVI